ncbi:MAG: hypothetical protein JXB48_00505 [Candidatus Latescibacteria bacterium]|nr:hypothetical protein [Candidatus Latescibacterota bacterium]
MVRPIELTDSLSKVQAVEQMQQDAKTRPEALHQFQKTLTDKQTEQLRTSPNPVPESDQVVIHVNEQEKDKHKTAEDERDSKMHRDGEKQDPKENGQNASRKKDGHTSPGHIDIKA